MARQRPKLIDDYNLTSSFIQIGWARTSQRKLPLMRCKLVKRTSYQVLKLSQLSIPLDDVKEGPDCPLLPFFLCKILAAEDVLVASLNEIENGEAREPLLSG
jgi:hypothetical protein